MKRAVFVILDVDYRGNFIIYVLDCILGYNSSISKIIAVITIINIIIINIIITIIVSKLFYNMSLHYTISFHSTMGPSQYQTPVYCTMFCIYSN